MTYLSSEDLEQQYINACGARLGVLHHRLVSECTSLHFKWGDYVELFGTSPERVEFLNRVAGSFFRIIQDSLWEDILLHLARLVDSPRSAGKDNLTLQRLPALVAPELQQRLTDVLDVCRQRCAFARDWRMRHIAHRDLALAVGDGAEPLAEASRKAVLEALSAIVDVLNAVERHYLKSEVAYDLGRSHGALELLYVLRDGLEARDRRLSRLRSRRREPGDAGPPRAV